MRILEGLGIHAEVHDGDGSYALFVHGILSSRAQWMLNLEPLGRVCRPVVVELLGHGRSPAPTNSDPYTPAGYVAAFERIREALAIEEWFVVGQSLGAALTMRYALDHSDRVTAHVFTNSSSALADDAWQRRMRGGATAMAAHIEAGGAEGLEALPIHPIHAKRMPSDVRTELVNDGALLRPEGVARTILHTVPTSSVRSEARSNRVPTLLVAGTREAEFSEPRQFAEANVPQLEVVDLDAGHAVNIQAAEGFDAAVAGFFSRKR